MTAKENSFKRNMFKKTIYIRFDIDGFTFLFVVNKIITEVMKKIKSRGGLLLRTIHGGFEQ